MISEDKDAFKQFFSSLIVTLRHKFNMLKLLD